MDGLRISELAARAGVATSTVRYYERVGLLAGPERTASGYRSYGRDAETRLLFITRAKRLGLSLEEIAELTTIWDGANCGATQERLVALLAVKRAEIADRISELEAFADQLSDVQTHLIASPIDGPCASDLNCCAPELGVTPVVLGVQRSASRSDATPVVACTLASDDRRVRRDEFANLARHVSTWSRDETSIRVRFPARDDVEALVRALSASEVKSAAGSRLHDP